jgi:pimeloyl-ACP methyl ester carboxylesterase
MEFVETPESRLARLQDYDFSPRFQAVDPAGLRMHSLDEGPRGAAPVLLLHGEPSWSYLYRSTIPPCVGAGHRVVAPDPIGFGKSSKPRDPAVPPNRRAWTVLERWEKPSLTVFGDGGPITRGLDRVLQQRIPGARGLPHRTVRGGHFLQEDAGPELAAAIVDLIARTPQAARR